MNESNEKGFGWESYVWRGGLGGVIGSLSLLLIGAGYVGVRFGRSNIAQLLFVGGIFGLIGGALAGMAIGYVIYWLARRWGQQPDVGTRAVIGFTFFIAFLWPQFLTHRDLEGFAVRVAYAALAGVLAGLMARDKQASAPLPVSADRAC